MFKASVEKLEKGWDVSVSVADFAAASALVASRHEAHNVDENEDKPSFRSGIKKLKDGSYRVTFYQSKLSQAQEVIKGLYKQSRPPRV